MEAFKQPVLPEDKEQLNNGLGYVKGAVAFWNDGKREKEYDKEFIDKNIEYFNKYQNRITKKLKIK